MKTYKEFIVYLNNADVRSIILIVDKPKSIGEFIASNWDKANSVSLIKGGMAAIPWHAVSLIEGVEGEPKNAIG